MNEIFRLPQSYYLIALIIGSLVCLGLFIDHYYATAIPKLMISIIENPLNLTWDLETLN